MFLNNPQGCIAPFAENAAPCCAEEGENLMQKIAMKTPLVEMDGDEMTRVLWQMIKEHAASLPYVDLKTEYYDLGLVNRDETDDQVTVDAANATDKVRRGRQVRHHHAQRRSAWRNTTSRRCGNPPTAPSAPCWTAPCSARPFWSRALRPVFRTWKKPITIARHAYGDVYKNTRDAGAPAPARRSWSYTDEDGTETRALIHDFKGARRRSGACTTWTTPSQSFARSCFELRAGHQAGSVVRHQGHHLQDLRPPLQGHLCRALRDRVQGEVRGGGHRILLHAHRRCGCAGHPLRGRLHLGVQELRRRRDERHGRHGLRLAWP